MSDKPPNIPDAPPPQFNRIGYYQMQSPIGYVWHFAGYYASRITNPWHRDNVPLYKDGWKLVSEQQMSDGSNGACRECPVVKAIYRYEPQQAEIYKVAANTLVITTTITKSQAGNPQTSYIVKRLDQILNRGDALISFMTEQQVIAEQINKYATPEDKIIVNGQGYNNPKTGILVKETGKQALPTDISKFYIRIVTIVLIIIIVFMVIDKW